MKARDCLYNCVIRVIEALRTSNIFSENWDMNKKNVNVSCLHHSRIQIIEALNVF